MSCKEFSIPENPKFDCFKEQDCKGATFMKEVHRQGINYITSEPEIHNQNPFEGIIREVRRKW